MPRDAVIEVHVELDDDQVPESIRWRATDADFEGLKSCEAILLSIWDKEEGSTLTIDLWGKEMLVDEMGAFVYQTLLALAATHRRATQQEEGADVLEEAARRFADVEELSPADE